MIRVDGGALYAMPGDSLLDASFEVCPRAAANELVAHRARRAHAHFERLQRPTVAAEQMAATVGQARRETAAILALLRERRRKR